MRQFGAHLLGQRNFAIFGLGVFEVGRGKVAGAVFQFHVRPVELDGEVAKAAVAGWVGGLEAEDVVRLGVVLDLLEERCEVVGVREELAAGV